MTDESGAALAKVLIIDLWTVGSVDGANDVSSNTTMICEQSETALMTKLKQIQYFCDPQWTYENELDGMIVSPKMSLGRRIAYRAIQLSDLTKTQVFLNNELHDIPNDVSSVPMTNITIKKQETDEVKSDDLKFVLRILVNVLLKEYMNFDAFVLIQHTDLIAETASYLSFMLENLRKTTIITGAIISLQETVNDAFGNILNSLLIAGHYTIPEVTVLFAGKLYRGNRCIKINSNSLETFDSPCFPPLATLGIDIKINWDLVFSDIKPGKELSATTDLLDKNILILLHYPGFSLAKFLEQAVNQKIDGIIIEAHVTTLPLNDKQFVASVDQCDKRRIPIVIVSQALRKYSSYSGSLKCQENGLVFGGDMTLEAAQAKLAYLLSTKTKDINSEFKKNYRGEISSFILNPQFNFDRKHFLENLLNCVNKMTHLKQGQADLLNKAILPNIWCQLAAQGETTLLQTQQNWAVQFDEDMDQYTPIHYAARKNQVESLKILIDRGADINRIDSNGCSPLFLALQNECIETVNFLIFKGAKPIATKNQICNYLLNAAQRNDLKAIQTSYHCGLRNLNEYCNCDKRNIGHIAAAFGHVKSIVMSIEINH